MRENSSPSARRALDSRGISLMRTAYIAVFAMMALGTSVTTVRVAPSAAGTISGKVTYTGTPPKMRPIDMAKEPACVTDHPTPVMTQDVVTGSANGVRYVVVYISGGDQGAPAATDTVRYDQKGCLYIPHVAV